MDCIQLFIKHILFYSEFMHVCVFVYVCLHVHVYAYTSEAAYMYVCLILDSSGGLSAGIQSAGDLVSETLCSNPAFSRGRQLVSFRFEYIACLCQSTEINNNRHV